MSSPISASSRQALLQTDGSQWAYSLGSLCLRWTSVLPVLLLSAKFCSWSRSVHSCDTSSAGHTVDSHH